MELSILVRPKTRRKKNSSVNCFLAESPFQEGEQKHAWLVDGITHKIKKSHTSVWLQNFGAPEGTQSATPLGYASLAFRFLFAKNLPPAAFFYAKSPLRVRVPLMNSQNKKSDLAMELSILVRPKGLEPLTYWFVASHSIQLSYERKCSILNTRYILPHFMAFVKRFYKLFILFWLIQNQGGVALAAPPCGAEWI